MNSVGGSKFMNAESSTELKMSATYIVKPPSASENNCLT